MNIDHQGQVCIGTADRPTDHNAVTQASWEAVLFKSNFSHINHAKTLKRDGPVSTEQQLVFWQTLAGKTRFPASVLNPMGSNLQEWLDHILA